MADAIEIDVVQGLTFRALRKANLKRLPQFKNARGGPAHSEPDGSDWSPAQWCMAVLGELGEAANLLKKVDRGDLTLDEARPALARELADVQTYLDLLAHRLGVDLGDATVQKWNEVSERIGCALRIELAATYFDGGHVRCTGCGDRLARVDVIDWACSCPKEAARG